MSSRNRRNQGEQDDPFSIPGGQIDETPITPSSPSLRAVEKAGYADPLREIARYITSRRS